MWYVNNLNIETVFYGVVKIWLSCAMLYVGYNSPKVNMNRPTLCRPIHIYLW